MTKKEQLVKLLFDIQTLQLERLKYMLFNESLPSASLVIPNYLKITNNRAALARAEKKLHEITTSLTATLKTPEDLQYGAGPMDFIEFNITVLQAAKIAYRSQLDYQETLCEEINTLMGVASG